MVLNPDKCHFMTVGFQNQTVDFHYEKVVIKNSRSSHQRCSKKKGVLRNFIKFTRKHLCQGLFFNKVAGLGHLFPEHLCSTAS